MSSEVPARASYYREGVAPILIASILWAFSHFFRKPILHTLSPVLLTFFTSLVIALSLFPRYRKYPRNIFSSLKRNPLEYACLVIFGGVLGHILMWTGLERLDLGITLILEKLQAVFIVVLATLILKEPFRLKKVPFMLLAIISSYFVATKTPFDFGNSDLDVVGVLCVVLSAVCWSLSGIFGKMLVEKKEHAHDITFLRFLLTAIVLLPSFIFYESLGLKLEIDWYVVFIIFITAIGGNTIAYPLYYAGLKNVLAGTAIFLEMTTVVFGVLLGIVFLSESFVASQVIAAIVLLYSIFKTARL